MSVPLYRRNLTKLCQGDPTPENNRTLISTKLEIPVHSDTFYHVDGSFVTLTCKNCIANTQMYDDEAVFITSICCCVHIDFIDILIYNSKNYENLIGVHFLLVARLTISFLHWYFYSGTNKFLEFEIKLLDGFSFSNSKKFFD